MDGTEHITGLIEPAIDAMGFEIVRVMLMGKTRPTLQVMIERKDHGGMTVDDCAEVSRAVSGILDEVDPIAGAYALEVTSPGIDRPLTRREDFSRFAGCEAKIELERPLDGRRRFQGRLAGIEGDTVRMRLGEDLVELPYAAIKRAKLVLTDELLAAAGAQD